MPDKPFRMETLEDVRFLAKRGDLLLSFDLTQGYQHVAVHPEDKKFLGLIWNNCFYQFNVLPFGLKSAPRWFTKIVTLLARSWRRDGIRALIYLDDWLFLYNLTNWKQSAQESWETADWHISQLTWKKVPWKGYLP